MKHAPAATAARITAGREVSTEIGIDVERARASTTGTTRAISSATDGGRDPGRVDSPPMSRSSAPCSIIASPWSMAAVGSVYRPPSENESGVTLTIPHTSGARSASRRSSRSAGADRRAPAVGDRSRCGHREHPLVVGIAAVDGRTTGRPGRDERRANAGRRIPRRRRSTSRRGSARTRPAPGSGSRCRRRRGR